MVGMPAITEIGEQGGRVPWHRRGRLRVDRISVPVVDIATGKGRARAFRAERIARGMASAAMRQPFDQIGAAIPFRALSGVRLVGAVAQKQQFPARDHHALIERKGKLVGAGGRVGRLPRHQKGVERAVILIADIGEMIIGKGRIEVLAAAIDARAHGAAERGFRPAADPGLRVRRDIRGIDRAERRRHRKSPGKVPAAARGVTGAAVSDRGKLAAAFDERGIERLRRGLLDRRDRRPPRDRKCRNHATDQERGNPASDNSSLCHPSQRFL